MEGGGAGLSYTNGIGSPQQHFNTTEAAASSSTSRTEQKGSNAVSPDKGPGSALPVDQAKLSTTAGVMARALTGSDVRTEKVAALQQSIAAGTYNVSSSDVADKVISALLR